MKGLFLTLLALVIIGYVIHRYYGAQKTTMYASWVLLILAGWGIYVTYQSQKLMEELDTITSPLALPSLTQLK